MEKAKVLAKTKGKPTMKTYTFKMCIFTAHYTKQQRNRNKRQYQI